MRKIDEIVDGFLRESLEDYVGLWAIAPAVRRDLGLSDNAEVKAHTLDVVRILLNRGLWPGDYLKSGFHFWAERDVESVIARIDKEWNSADGDPPLGDSICWFGVVQAH